jgi:diguanylate cyclase (GGDEF)-like protein/PAS domain S-box-containing protein
MKKLPTRRASWLYIAAGALVALTFLVPGISSAKWLYLAISVAMPLAGVVGLVCDKPAERRQWITFVVGLALIAVGEVAYHIAVFRNGLIGWSDAIELTFLLGYLVQLVGLVGLIGQRSTVRGRNSWLDALSTGFVVFMALWGTLREIYSERGASSAIGWISQLGGPILGAALIVMAVRLLLGEGRARASFGLLVAAYVLQTTADMTADLASSYQLGGDVDLMWAFAYLFIGIALLHPDRLVGPRPAPTVMARRDVNQVLAIQGLLIVAMIAVISSSVLRTMPTVTVIAWSAAGFGMLVINRVRIYGLIRDVSDASVTEQTRRLTALVENSHEVIGLADADGTIRFVSASVEDMTGHPPAWWVGRHFPAVVLQAVDGIDDFIHRVTLLADGESASWEGEIRQRVAPEARVVRLTIANHIATPEVNGWVITARNVTDEARLTSELRHQALHDSLTALPNRTLLADRISHAAERGRRSAGAGIAVLLVDLDDFKSVNDSLGHDTGDELLQTVAKRLTDAVRPGDTVARLGGDEFAVLLEETGELEAQAVADRIMDSLSLPLRVGSSDFAVKASIGLVTSVDHADPVELLRAADIAMYAAKRDGKGRVMVFHEHMHDTARRLLALRMDLANALARDELSLVYQPIVCTQDGALSGFEALLRWQHPTRGAVPPIEFIPVAEQAGLIGAIGAWVLRHACAEASRWADTAQQPYISVNVSALQLRDCDFARTVAEVLREAGLAPERLLLEITESTLVDEAGSTRETLSKLRELGTRIAIDDFGTGYSSLSYLRELAVDVVKIDRSFTRDLAVNADHRALTSTMLALADGLAMTAIAEGVETELDLAELRRLGCRFAQGYHFAKPLPADQLGPWLAEQRPAGV